MTPWSLDWVVAGAFWGLCVMSLFNLNDVAGMWVGVERAFSVPMLICCLVALLGLLRFRLTDVLDRKGALLLAALLSHAGIGILLAIAGGIEDPDTVEYLRRYLTSIVVILATAVGGRVVWERAGGDRTLLVILVVLTAACAVILASPWLLQVFQNPPPDGEYRYSGQFSNPNEAGVLACLAAALALSFLRAGRFSLLAYGGLLVAASAEIATFSRTGYVVLLVTAFAAVLTSRANERRRVLGGLAVIALVSAITLAYAEAGVLADPQVSRVDSMLEAVELRAVDDVTMSGRLTLWRIALEEALDAPLLGRGIGQFHSLDEAWYNSQGVLLGAHNTYLVLLGEAGFIPLAFFVLFLAGMLRMGFGRKSKPAAAGAVSGWALVLAIAAIADHDILLYRHCNFILGLSCAIVAVRADEERRARHTGAGATASATP